MKIYCTAKRSTTDLSRYVGKDVWIHGLYVYYGAYWFRILSEQPHAWYVNYISDTDLLYGNKSALSRSLDRVHFVPKVDFSPQNPIEIMTFTELLDEYSQYQE